MYLVAVVVLSCLAVSLADQHCGPLERIKVQQQWARIYGADIDRQKMATAVWRDFFEHHDEEVARFSNVNGGNVYSADFRAHMLRVFAGFDLLIGTIHDDAVFKAALAHYTKMHVDLGVGTDIVKEFGKSLGRVLPDFVQGNPAAEAWRPCFDMIAQGVTGVSMDDAPEEKLADEDKAAAENEV